MSYFSNIYYNFEDFSQHHPRKGRLLAIDYGKARCGVAMSDISMRIAMSHSMIYHTKFTKIYQQLEYIMQQEAVIALVVGYPINSNGSVGPMAQAARQFAYNIVKNGYHHPILLSDERFSSQAIDRIIIDEADISRKKQQKVRDKLAAQFVLQTYCDWRINTL